MNYKISIKWWRLAIFAVVTLSISTGLVAPNHGQLQASNAPQPATVVAQETTSAIWRHGSFPVESFQSYTSPFGYRRSPVNGQIQFHNGLDLAAPRGSYVRSWWTGKVIEVSDNTACGTSLTIESGTWKHTYCHLEGHVENSSSVPYIIDRDGGIKIARGQDIPVGTRIGRIGMTGRTTGPHLHWVLKHNNNYVDPAMVLKEMFKVQASLPSDLEN